MTVSVREGRPRRSRLRSRSRPSVREVCLLGVSRPAEGWSEGDRLTWSGRVYRVEATGAREGGPESQGAGYVHLGLSGDD